MRAPQAYRLRNQQLWLSATRSVFWEEEKALILADLHFGKTGHFRKAGLAVPPAVYKEDLQRLFDQIQYYQPSQLIVVGDLFHSRVNKELELFQKWRENFSSLVIHLIKGNHDILEDGWYKAAGIEVSHPSLEKNHFQFIHDIETQRDPGKAKKKRQIGSSQYYFSGHIHPGIRINGAGKQSLCFPCFYFAKNYAVLPAFSRFTGVALIDPEKTESVFAIVDDRVMQIY
ncbi:MAG: ligase-associated DNA damage response endonuclease PdeM [Chitinophagales bacterium]